MEAEHVTPEPVRNRMTREGVQSFHRRWYSYCNSYGMLNCDGYNRLFQELTRGSEMDYSYIAKQAQYDISQWCGWKTYMRKRHEIGFCFCAGCVEQHDLGVEPFDYDGLLRRPTQLPDAIK